MLDDASSSAWADPGRLGELFDFVIFDEASQVCPEDSITAVVRGNS